MLYEAQHAPVEKKILLQFVKSFRRSRKTPIPKTLAAGPKLGPGVGIYYAAFWELVTERRDPDSPIPWSKIRLWARLHGLDAEATESCEYLVREMDLAFLKWKRQNSRKGKHSSEEGPNDGDSRPVRSEHAKVRSKH